MHARLLCIHNHIIFFRTSQNLCSAMKNLCSDVPSGPSLFPLFANRFATYTGGILVSFKERCFFLNGVKCSAWNIYHTHSFRWNWWICFPCILNPWFLGISIKDLLWFKHDILLFMYLCISICPQTLAEIYRDMDICDVSGHWSPEEIYPGFIWLTISQHRYR